MYYVLMGKSHKVPFSSSDAIYTTPLQLVQIDIWELDPIKSIGSRYYISFVDAYYRFTRANFLGNKSDAISVVISFRTFVKTKTQIPN